MLRKIKKLQRDIDTYHVHVLENAVLSAFPG